ncbi:MAG: hypothetical protein AAB334_00395 [Patescibacteria group bacterium]
MSRKTSIFVMTIIVVLFIAIIVNDNYTKKRSNKENIPGSTKKSEMVAHYGKSAEVELLKIDDNNWQLVNYNGYFVTIRRVTISLAYGAGETTVSVQRIGAKGSINFKNLNHSDGFYIYDSYGALSGWLRADEIHYLTEPL